MTGLRLLTAATVAAATVAAVVLVANLDTSCA